MATLTAKITNRRLSPTKHYPNGALHLCEVTCPNCENTLTVSYGGWTALICNGANGCGATLQRFDPKTTKLDPLEALGIVTCFVGLRTGNGCTSYEGQNFVEASQDESQLQAALDIVRAHFGGAPCGDI